MPEYLFTPERQRELERKISRELMLSDNGSGEQMIAGLNKTIVIAGLIGFGVWWFFLRR